MYDRLTRRARRVLDAATAEARRRNHEYVGTEHILLAVVKEGGGVATMVLEVLSVDLAKVREEVEAIIHSAPETIAKTLLPQTPRAKMAIEYAIEEARNLGHNYVGSEHLLLGLIREAEGVAAQVLMGLGLRIEDVRAETWRLVGATTVTVKSKLDGARDAYSELTDLPASVIEALKAIDKEMDQVAKDKENAIATQDYDKAAGLCDQLEQLKKKWLGTICQWNEPEYFI